MSTTSTSDIFVKTYADLNYRFPAMVRHNGVVLAFAMDAKRSIYYTVLDFGAGGSMSMVDADHWSPNPRPLTFAREIASVGFGVADQSAVPTVRTGSTVTVPPGQSVRPDETDPFLSTTARFTAAVPFQLVSDGRYVYVFRQAITDPGAAAVNAAQLVLVDPKATPDALTQARDIIADHQNMAYVSDATGAPVLDAHGRQIPTVAGTVLVDRFVLVGTTLEPKLEVRYQRSLSRTRPAGTTDSLGAADLNKQPFVEPTQNLRFVPSITQGRFAATLVPTQVAEVFRWQLFAHDAAGDVIWSYSVERTADGLFDTLGTQPLTCTDHPDVYAVTAGTCPRPSVDDPTVVCGKTLVAKVPDGGASGSALSFPTDGSGVVTIDGARTTGTEFTIESWLAPDPAATGERVLIGCAGDPKAAGPSIWLHDPQALRIGFGDGQAFRDVTTPPILASGEWNHFAVTYAAGQLQVYVNGQIQFASNALGAAVPSPTPVAAFGASSGGFAGRLDDVRIWSVALSAQDIQAGRHSTLTGLEAGLVGYWRFDEGTGTATWDAASGAKALLDGPAWVTSDAPIAVAPGLSRSALRLTGRSVTGGLTATLYYQQENAVSGYPGAQPAPLKQAARVMLAAVTGTISPANTPGATTTAAEATPTVVAVDFGVGVDGSLAQLPGEVTLSELDVPGGGPGTGADVLANVFSAKADVATLTQTVADDNAALAGLLAAQQAVTNALAGNVTDPASLQDTEATLAINNLVFATSRLNSLQNPGGGFAVILQPFVDFAQRDVQTARTGLQNYQAALPAKEAVLTATLTADQGRLAAAQANLDTLQRLLNGDTVLPMPLLHVDGSGLTTAGAVLGFAPATGSPMLVDGAMGRVTLYFQDAGEEFLLTYYDTFTGRTMLHLPAETGELTFVARSAAADYDDLSVQVTAGSDDSTCTLVATLPGAVPVTETWTGVPRDAAALAAIMNGTTQTVFVGTAAAASGKVDTLTLTAPLTVPLGAGAVIRVAGQVLTTTTAAPRGATSVAVEPQTVSIAADSAVQRLAYDTAQATSTRAGADLRAGSLLVGVDARSASGAVQLGAARSLGATPSCRWFASPPGTTVDFNGTSTRAGVMANTALRLNGSSGVMLGTAPDLDITGPITLEAWVRPAAAPKGFANVVARGASTSPQGEVYLRIFNGKYQIGAWNGADHFTDAPVPAGDYGTWVHLAGVYDGSAWHLYRNGLLLNSTNDPIGAVPVAAGWAVGTNAVGNDRFFTGDVDDIRIWNRPLGPQEITDGMSHRLAGSEAGLAAYLYMDHGVLVDHDASPVSTKPVGGTPQVASPPALGRLAGFDVTGDVSVETWMNPTGAGVGRMLVHHSDNSAYGLGVRQRNTALHFDGGGRAHGLAAERAGAVDHRADHPRGMGAARRDGRHPGHRRARLHAHSTGRGVPADLQRRVPDRCLHEHRGDRPGSGVSDAGG